MEVHFAYQIPITLATSILPRFGLRFGMTRRAFSLFFLTGIVSLYFSFAFGNELTEYREKFLLAKTLPELGIPQNQLFGRFLVLMNDVIREDPELAADLVLHTDRLIFQEERKRGGGWYKAASNGWTHMGSYLESYEKRTESLDAIGVMVRSFQKDSQGRIPFVGWVPMESQFGLFGHFLGHGGNYDTAAATEKLITDLRTVCGEGQTVFLAPYFCELCDFLRPAQRNELAKQAIELSDDADLTLSGIGEAIALGLALFERAEGTPVDHPDLARGTALDSLLLEILKDDTISLAWRAGFTALMGLDFRENLSPELRIEIGKILALVLEKEIPFAGKSFSHSIAAFLRGDDADEVWKNTGKRLLSAWEKRNSLNHLPEKTGRALRPEKEWIIPVMGNWLAGSAPNSRSPNTFVLFATKTARSPGALGQSHQRPPLFICPGCPRQKHDGNALSLRSFFSRHRFRPTPRQRNARLFEIDHFSKGPDFFRIDGRRGCRSRVAARQIIRSQTASEIRRFLRKTRHDPGLERKPTNAGF